MSGPRVPRRLLAAGLVLSLSVNAFFIGVAATNLITTPTASSSSTPRALRVELRWFDARLSDQTVTDIEAALMEIKPEVASEVDRMRAMRVELDMLLAAPVPDRAAVDAKFREITDLWNGVEDHVAGRTFDALLQLPPEKRAGLASHP